MLKITNFEVGEEWGGALKNSIKNKVTKFPE